MPAGGVEIVKEVALECAEKRVVGSKRLQFLCKGKGSYLFDKKFTLLER